MRTCSNGSRARARRAAALGLAFLALACTAVTAQEAPATVEPLSVTVFPAGGLPFSDEYFTAGGGAVAGVEYRLPFLPALAPRLEVGYDYMPLWTGGTVNLFTASAGATVNLNLGPRIRAWAVGVGGYSYGLVGGTEDRGGNASFAGGAGIGIRLLPFLTLGAEARYRAVTDGLGGLLWSGATVGAGARIVLAPASGIEIESIEVEPIFPVLYKYYADNPIGSLVLRNTSSVPVSRVSAALMVSGYMDNPTTTALTGEIGPGEQATLPLTALFNPSVLEITEGDVISGRINLNYETRGREYTDESSTQIRFFDRNAITWDDDEKAAAYVTARDPDVGAIASEAARIVRTRLPASFDDNFLKAIAIHVLLSESGIAYVVDPTTPYVEFSRDEQAVDYLKFPTNTLGSRTGDCDDLSILYASLLQAVGVETAFVTIPGHIYIAFSLGMTPETARRTFLQEDDLIYHDERAWVPFEVTLIGGDFLEAWNTGAQQWRAAGDQARIYPMYEAWSTYQPVASVDAGTTRFRIPGEDTIWAGIAGTWERFVRRETHQRMGQYTSRMSGRSAPRYANAIGVLFARYGLLEEAEEYFLLAGEAGDYPPALANLGGLRFQAGEFEEALALYQRAATQSDPDGLVELQMARAYYELGMYGEASDRYALAAELDPELASRYAYLSPGSASGARATSRDQLLREVPWLEDEE